MAPLVIQGLALAAMLGGVAGISPSPHTVLVVQNAIVKGLRRSLLVCLVAMLVDFTIIAFASLMVGRLPGVFTVALHFVGGIYLLWLASKSFRFRSLGGQAAMQPPEGLAVGLLVQVLNPNPYIFWTTVGIAQLNVLLPYGLGVTAVFLLVFFAALLTVKMMIAWVARRSQNLFAQRHYGMLVRGTAGIFGVIGMIYLAKGFYSLPCFTA